MCELRLLAGLRNAYTKTTTVPKTNITYKSCTFYGINSMENVDNIGLRFSDGMHVSSFGGAREVALLGT
jgi:hypothetical protein